MTIVDTHAHFLEAESASRPHDPRFKASSGFQMTPLSPDELAKAAADGGVDRIVQVTTSNMGFDNRHSFEGVRRRPDRYLGVICRADPFSPRMQVTLEELAAQPETLGVRLTLTHEWARDWLDSGRLDPFFVEATRRGLAVNIIAPGLNAELQAAAERHPDLRFVLDHMNMRYVPGLTAQTAFLSWPQLLPLASLKNVWTKVSHFPEAVMASEDYPYPSAQIHLKSLYETLGARRLMWGSNYPLVLRTCSYRRALDFVRDECDFIPAAERDLILGDNFIRDFCGESRLCTASDIAG